MQITLTIHIPEEQLKIALEKDGMTRSEFIASAREALGCMPADDLCPGATAEVKVS